MSWIAFLPAIVFAVMALILVAIDPRRVACAVLLGLTIVSVLLPLFGFAVEDLTSGVYWLLGILVITILLVLILAVLLIWAGVALIRREGFRPAHSLSLGLGILMFVYPVLGTVFVVLNVVEYALVLLSLGFVVAYFAFVLVSILLYSEIYGFFARRFHKKYEMVVVLGAGIAGKELTPLLRARVDLGIAKYRNIQGVRLVFSGGKGPDEEISEARAMADYALKMGVSQDDVYLEDQSRSTEQNLRFSKRFADEKAAWLAVSSDYHAFRAACLMRKENLHGAAIGARTPRYFWASAALREYVAILRDHLGLNILIALITGVPFVVVVVGQLLS